MSVNSMLFILDKGIQTKTLPEKTKEIDMKKRIVAVIMWFTALALTGCGSDGSTTVIVTSPTIVTQILSNPAIDGDIAVDTVNNVDYYTITQGMSSSVQSVYAGIDPFTLIEYRTFLNFPLGGIGGVPTNGIIESAKLDIFINDILPLTGTIPLRIDLVEFQPPTLIASDFSIINLPALRSISTSIFQSDFGKHVVIDVTTLMREAQHRGLPDFQIRIMEDLGIVSPGLIEIDDTTATAADRASYAPQLEVTYY